MTSITTTRLLQQSQRLTHLTLIALPIDLPSVDTALCALQRIVVSRGRRVALDDVSLSIAPAEVITIVGPNGGGKTTLLEVILGVITPSSGTVYRRPKLRMAYMPQRARPNPMLPVTIARFLRLCNVAADDAHVVALGVDSIADHQLRTLSGGQWQRVLCAVTLAQPADILLLDEPTQGMDVEAQAVVYQAVERKRTTQRTAVVIVSHDVHVVMQRSDLVICLHTHVCCSGGAGDVRAHPAYRQLFGVYTHHHDHSHDADINVLPTNGSKPNG